MKEHTDGLSEDDRLRYRLLFDKLDINKDGEIEMSELAKGMKALHVPDPKLHAKEVIKKADKDDNATLNFEEFIDYMQQHENKLKLAFGDLDKNKDGQIEPAEVQAALESMGISVSYEEAAELTKRCDKNNNLLIDWEEWRDFFGLWPSADLEFLMKQWRDSIMIDIGDTLIVPPEFTKKERQSGQWWKHLVAGGLAGAISRTCTAPLDRVKVMLQVHGSKVETNILGLLKQMVKEGGSKSLWRGNGTNVIKIGPESAIKFAAYEQLKLFIKGDRKQEITMIERFAAGSSAGAFAQTVIYPLEVVKTKLAVSKTGQYKGIMDCLVKTSSKFGVKSLFKGYLPNVMGIIPYAGIDLTIYETVKQVYIKRNPEKNKNPNVLVLLGCGTLSSTCGQLASYPFALIRTKLQAATTEEARAGFVPLTKHIFKKEGFGGFYRGLAPNFLKVLPAVSISYVIYEQAKLQLGL